jgi:hypothetical protein
MPPTIPSGIPPLDAIIQHLRLGDNVVWQVQTLDDYCYFVHPFVGRAIQDERQCIYLRFAPHAPVLAPRAGLEIIPVDPSPGFDAFTSAVHRIIRERGEQAFYVFDNLSALVVEWATDESLANFFQVTCPYLFELDTVTYFALTRGQHAHHAVARIRETTQLLIDVYTVKGQRYLHPLKVWDRYSPQMFIPYIISEAKWTPVLSSGAAAEVSSLARRKPLGHDTSAYAPWDSVYQKLRQYAREGCRPEDSPEMDALKREFSRMMLGHAAGASEQPEFSQLVDRYFDLDTLFTVRDRLIGRGRIGGKAAGMLLARRIIAHYEGATDFDTVIESHDSFYVGSDVFFTFLVNNDLFRLRMQWTDASSAPDDPHAAFAEVEQRFLAGTFPPQIVDQFRNMLDYYGQAPIIVRSSSLLEDSFGNAFAGKYRSEFCANQGSPEARLNAFLRAVKLVYASALNPDVLAYKRKWDLTERDEQMAILVQRVSGQYYRDFFFPTLAGVALSRNLYVWADRIDPHQGLVRLVFGLGTRAVNRVGFDYPRMIAISHPDLRPEVGRQVAKYSQTQVDVIDLAKNQFVTYPFTQVIAENDDYANLHLLISEVRDGALYDPISRRLRRPARRWVLTFNNLIRRTEFVNLIGETVAALEAGYGCPVETEFTASIAPDGHIGINLLQCRPLHIPGASAQVPWPEFGPDDQILFRSQHFIGGGAVDKIRYLVYISPERYAAMRSMEAKRTLGRLVGRVNARLREAGEKEMLIGPGRFGSSNINLGVNVSYRDIDNAAVLVELAHETEGQSPEVSYGTHFFQDLVESQTLYLAVQAGAETFNQVFFDQAPNALGKILPDAAPYVDVLKVIDIHAIADGAWANVVADPEAQRAVCYVSNLLSCHSKRT